MQLKTKAKTGRARRILGLGFLAGTLLALGSCRSQEVAAGGGVVATTAMIGDVAREIADGAVPVEVLMSAGVDPHLYKATATDVRKLSAARLILYNGLKLEGTMGDLFGKLSAQGIATSAVAEKVSWEGGAVLDAEEGHPDPHLWMDVSAWRAVAGKIGAELAAAFPEEAERFAANLAAYDEELRALDEYARESLASIPEGSRVLVTAHDAFGYLAKAYGIEVLGIQGISTESEAGLKDLEDLIDLIVERKIPAVFVESSVSQKNVRALIEGAAARGHQVSIGGELFSDAMGPAGSYEGTYLGMIDHNVTLITRALGGVAPEKGRLGKLASGE
ncbi:MAG: metal ABC transporter solute-binding protein, Zn/Mn family [Verrucomicrobiales bacterium]